MDYFGTIADRSGCKVEYQTLINSALREYVEGKVPKWEETLRRIIREEMARDSAAWAFTPSMPSEMSGRRTGKGR